LTARGFYIRHIGTDEFRIGPKPKRNKVMADRRASLDEQRDVRLACFKLVKEVFEQGATLPVIPFPEETRTSWRSSDILAKHALDQIALRALPSQPGPDAIGKVALGMGVAMDAVMTAAGRCAVAMSCVS
jgi:hypothetical protein